MKRVLVTGSSRGIGKAIAEALTAEGYQVVTHSVKSGGTDLQFDIADRAAATLTLAIDLAGADRSARSMEGNVFAGIPAPTFFNPAWNRARVTVRGETAAQECIEARATAAGFVVRFR